MADIVKRLIQKNISLSYKLAGLLNKNTNREDGLYRSELKQFLLSKKEHMRGKTVLDIGSGSWTWTKETFSPLCQITTFDMVAHPQADVVGDLYHLDTVFPDGTFDAIIATDIFEHLSRPFDGLKQLHRVLKPRGIIIASAPFKKNLHGEEYGDYWRITRQGWRYLLENNGFQEITISWLGEEQFPLAYFVSARKST